MATIRKPSDGKGSVFQRQPWVSIFALTAAVLWGWAYPLIKLGFGQFGIEADMIGGKMLFAGVRFFMSGAIILFIARLRGKTFAVKEGKNWLFILAFALLNTTLHYAFFYVGLSNSAGSRAAILNSLGVFLVVILACIFFKGDRMNARKVLGCVIGFAGILILNTGSDSGRFTMMGDGLIILNALCSAAASLMTRGLSRRVDIFVGTGYSLALGGALLMLTGVLMGAGMPTQVTLAGCAILMMLIVISTTGFTLYNKLLSCNPVGKVAIYNSLIPIIGALTSCMCLDEPFYWKYLISGSMAALGIYIINKGK